MIRASSLSRVRSVGRRQDVGADLRLERAGEEREVGDRPEAGNRHRALHHAERQALADGARIDGDVDDVVAAAARREVGAADDACLRRVVAGQRLPLDAELGRLVRRDLDDQRLDEHLRAADVELLDDRAQIVVHRLGRHDDERVARRVGGDRRAVRREGRVAAPTARPDSGGRRWRGAVPPPPVPPQRTRLRRRRRTAGRGARRPPPVSIARSVCATRAASAFFR